MLGPTPGRFSQALCGPPLAFLLLLLTAGLALAAPAGNVVGVFGQCLIEHSGTQGPLALGQSVEVGDTLDVPAAGKLKLRMADGSVISVASGSRMTVAAFGLNAAGQRQDAKLVLAEGLLRAVVAPTAHPASFEVDTAVGTAAVRSTDWFIEAKPAATEVNVLEGAVMLTGRTPGHEVIVDARMGSTVDAGHPPRPPHAVSQAAFDALIARTSLNETHLGWCQCIANHNEIQHACLASTTACQTTCASTHFSFIPDAIYSCGLESP
jgi:hypothetical protein